jgi:DNA-binding transcriptional ArsR family regulator
MTGRKTHAQVFFESRVLPPALTQEIGIVYPSPQGFRLAKAKAKDAAPEAAWTFLTNHSHVLLCLVQDPEARMRDVADKVGITERAVQRIVSELEAAGYVTRTREGRRNTYEVDGALPLRHAVEGHQTLNALIKLILEDRES